MPFSEALRLLITADTHGAVSGIQKVGDTTKRELGKSQQHLDRFGRGLSTGGAAAVAFGAAALVGLGHAAKASEEANLAQVKLQNTLDNMPKLAGQNAKQFIDLADKLQDVTAADGDAIVEGEALLGTFNLTAQQIKGITPLVVDYARKFGTDIPSAAIQVGKALDGSVGALKRNGVSIDETLFKTDRYAAVQKALSDQVGGFAKEEGATFAGSLERLRNNLGDLEEGVGRGAVEAFSSMFGAVDKVSGAFERLSPGTQSAIGKFATFAAVGLTAAGGLSFLLGQAITARQRFGELASGIGNLGGSIGRLGTTAKFAGGAAGTLALVIGLKELQDAANNAGPSVDQMARNIDKVSKSGGDVVDVMGAVGTSMGKDTVSQVRKLADENLAAAQRFVDLAEKSGFAKDQVAALQKVVDEAAASQRQGASDAKANADAVNVAGDAYKDQAGSVSEAQAALQEYNDTLHGLLDPLFGAVDAQMDLKEANGAVRAAELEVIDATKKHGAGSLEAQAAQDKLTEAQRRAGKSALDLDGAMATLRAQVKDGTTSVGEARDRLDTWVRSGLISKGTAKELAREFSGTAKEADRLGRTDPTVDVRSTGTSGVVNALLGIRALISNIPRSIGIEVAFHQTGTPVVRRQHGGPLAANQPAIVGEGGRPELFIPKTAGVVVPMGHAAGGGSNVGMGGRVEVVVRDERTVVRMPDGKVVEALKRYNQTNGPIPIKVA